MDDCNSNCNSNGDGHGNDNRNGKCDNHASFPEASIVLFDELKRASPQVHVSRRLSRKVASSIDVDIVHKVIKQIAHRVGEKYRRMKDQDANIPLTRFEQSFGGHVPLGDDGNDGDDDDGACSPPRSAFPISFGCLDSQGVGTENKMHIESHV